MTWINSNRVMSRRVAFLLQIPTSRRICKHDYFDFSARMSINLRYFGQIYYFRQNGLSEDMRRGIVFTLQTWRLWCLLLVCFASYSLCLWSQYILYAERSAKYRSDFAGNSLRWVNKCVLMLGAVLLREFSFEHLNIFHLWLFSRAEKLDT